MEKLIVKVVYQDNFGAYCDTVLGCVATHKTFEGVKEAYTKSLKLHIKGMLEDGDKLPEELQGEYTLEFVMNVQALLKHYKNIISFSALEKVTGINQQQLSHYASGYRNPRPKQRDKIIEGFHKIGKECSSIHSY